MHLEVHGECWASSPESVSMTSKSVLEISWFCWKQWDSKQDMELFHQHKSWGGLSRPEFFKALGLISTLDAYDRHSLSLSLGINY